MLLEDNPDEGEGAVATPRRLLPRPGAGPGFRCPVYQMAKAPPRSHAAREARVKGCLVFRMAMAGESSIDHAVLIWDFFEPAFAGLCSISSGLLPDPVLRPARVAMACSGGGMVTHEPHKSGQVP